MAEQLAYRVVLLSHEAFITTAQRKGNILKLAKLISYNPSRNIAANGLVKVSSISTSENVYDSLGNNLAGLNIVWNDSNNANWKEQFFLVFNRVVQGQYGLPSATVQVGDVVMQLYTFNNTQSSLTNGVYPFTADTGLETFPMEIVPVLLDANGPYEKTPDVFNSLSVIYAQDGLGDSSDYTGFLMYIRQGILSNIPYSMPNPIPNRSLVLAPINVNDTDVWVTQVDSNNAITNLWQQVSTLNDINLNFNTDTNRDKFEVETLENDQIKLLFGDGDFSAIPVGNFLFWTRQSANATLVIPPNKMVNIPMAFQYTANDQTIQTARLTFSLTATIQNSAPSETIEHIRQAAPSTYYAQNRMVNAQDYNTFMLKDQSILRMVSINRTFAGQPKYLEWNDASGAYQNVKLFGDDLQLQYNISLNSINTDSTITSRNLIDKVIEPLLSMSGVVNLLNHISATGTNIDGNGINTTGVISLTRTSFIEDNQQFYYPTFNSSTRGPLLEKTLLQGAIDQHFYGEPLSYQYINGVQYALVPDPILNPSTTDKIWLNTIPRTIDGVNPFVAGDVGSGLQTTARQTRFGLAYVRATPMIGDGITANITVNARTSYDNGVTCAAEVYTIEVAANQQSFYVSSNLNGFIGTGTIGSNESFLAANPTSPVEVVLYQSGQSFALSAGDAVVVRLAAGPSASWTNGTMLTQASPNVSTMNLLGSWQLINGTDLLSTTQYPNTLQFDPTIASIGVNPNSWIIWVQANLNPATQQAMNYTITYRELKLVASSATTNFWYNTYQQIIDSQTGNRVYDIIRVLRSNIRPDGYALGVNENYDVIGPILDATGNPVLTSLEIMPIDLTTGTSLSSNVLQFENFVDSANPDSSFYVYYQLNSDGTEVPNTRTKTEPAGLTFNYGSFVSSTIDNSGILWGRTLGRLSLDSNFGLDFMWQHFTPQNNLIDPSTSNIHDTYLLTQGYYSAMQNYLQGFTSIPPVPPSPLELRNSYDALLQSKMLSDTVVLHSANIKLLFGQLADPQFRATFKVVRAGTASLTNEALKNEILSVINTYFGIDNWDFGDTFYATELFSLIHQRLPSEVASVVLVPIYAVNSFGSLFTISSGFNEILQTCAQLSDIEIVNELNSSVLRQGLIA